MKNHIQNCKPQNAAETTPQHM